MSQRNSHCNRTATDRLKGVGGELRVAGNLLIGLLVLVLLITNGGAG
ncbi:MAG TPA: hypothetical protein VFM52_08655 [Rhodanobacter sp.]|nr:hypothetical protein [Rhodanobacter sp.]